MSSLRVVDLINSPGYLCYRVDSHLIAGAIDDAKTLLASCKYRAYAERVVTRVGEGRQASVGVMLPGDGFPPTNAARLRYAHDFRTLVPGVGCLQHTQLESLYQLINACTISIACELCRLRPDLFSERMILGVSDAGLQSIANSTNTLELLQKDESIADPSLRRQWFVGAGLLTHFVACRAGPVWLRSAPDECNGQAIFLEVGEVLVFPSMNAFDRTDGEMRPRWVANFQSGHHLALRQVCYANQTFPIIDPDELYRLTGNRPTKNLLRQVIK